MNKLAAITAFLGGQKNRYIVYEPERNLREKLEIAHRAEGLDGVELCYPADFEDPAGLRRLLADTGLGVAAVNVRSRRSGKWLRGSFTSQDPGERAEVVDDFRRAIDMAREAGTMRITTCPLNDGHDYAFEMNYFDAYRYAEETFAAICAHDRGVKVCIEYKINDPRTRCLLGSAGETAAFCAATGAPNLGATLDIGHSLLAGERPAQTVAMLHRAGRLFYVHLNDNDHSFDWDMLPGSFNLWEFVEFFFYLREAGYDGDWYSYDVASKEIDTAEFFTAVTRMTRRMEEATARLDRAKTLELMKGRNPARAMLNLFDAVLPEGR
jgi:xylose isomerase